MREKVSRHIQHAKISSSVVALEGMFCWGLRLAIPIGTTGTVMEILQQQDLPDSMLIIDWILDGRKVTLRHKYTHGMIGLIVKNEPQAV